MRLRSAFILLIVVPSPVAAHEAFGDLGPFYQAMLHPFADPAQGLVLAAVAVWLARQPISSVRVGYALLVGAGVAGLLLASLAGLSSPPLRVMALAALAIAAFAFLPWRAGWIVSALVAIVGGLLAALTVGADDLLRLIGAAAGIAIVPLFLWGAAELADRRVFAYASLVMAAWIGAIALMVSALPA